MLERNKKGLGFAILGLILFLVWCIKRREGKEDKKPPALSRMFSINVSIYQFKIWLKQLNKYILGKKEASGT